MSLSDKQRVGGKGGGVISGSALKLILRLNGTDTALLEKKGAAEDFQQRAQLLALMLESGRGGCRILSRTSAIRIDGIS